MKDILEASHLPKRDRDTKRHEEGGMEREKMRNQEDEIVPRSCRQKGGKKPKTGNEEQRGDSLFSLWLSSLHPQRIDVK